MRAVFAVVLLALVASSSAINLSDLGSSAFDTVKDVGNDILQKVLEVGQNFLTDTVKSLLPNILSSVLGKRELPFSLKQIAAKISDLANKAKSHASNAFSAAVDGLKNIYKKFHQNLGTNVDLKDLNDQIKQVAEQHQNMQKRILGDLLDAGKNLVGGVVDSFSGIASSVKDKLSGLASSALQKVAELAAKAGLFGKRALSDHLATIGNALSSAFVPFKDIISNLGSTLSGHASNIMDSLSGHVDALKGKLSGHIADLSVHGGKLLEHGQNALSALGGAVSDILQQTLANSGEHIDGIAKTIIDGAGVVGDHINGAGY